VISLLKLCHPSQGEEEGSPLVHIYGPEVKYDRGGSVAFNIFDRTGALVNPGLVQRLADRNNISLGLGTLCNIVYPDRPIHLLVRSLYHTTWYFLVQWEIVHNFACTNRIAMHDDFFPSQKLILQFGHQCYISFPNVCALFARFDLILEIL
jgi:hypothetical protein